MADAAVTEAPPAEALGAGLLARERGRNPYAPPPGDPGFPAPHESPGEPEGAGAPQARLSGYPGREIPAAANFGVDCGLVPPGLLRGRRPFDIGPSPPTTPSPAAPTPGGPAAMGAGLANAPAPVQPPPIVRFEAPRSARSFREELAAVIAKFVGEEAGRLTAGLFAENTGLAGGPRRSTRAIAETTFEHGRRTRVSRERVRFAVAQGWECLSAAAPNTRVRHWSPAIAAATAEAPLPLPDFLAWFGYASPELRPIRLAHHLAEAATLLGLEFPFQYLEGPFEEIWVVSDAPEREADSIQALEWLASLPPAPWHDLESLFEAPWRPRTTEIRTIIRRSAHWGFLGARERYFRRLPGSRRREAGPARVPDRNPVLRTLRRQFAFGAEAPRPTLARAVARARTFRRPVPPPVVAGIATQSGLFEADRRVIRRKPGLAWPAFSAVDQAIAELAARRPGRILPRRALLAALSAAGMTKGSAKAEITTSPLLLPASSLPDGRYRFLFTARTLRLPKPD